MVSDSSLAGRVRRVGALQLSITVRFPSMSAAESHVLRARLFGAQPNKARRGERCRRASESNSCRGSKSRSYRKTVV